MRKRRIYGYFIERIDAKLITVIMFKYVYILNTKRGYVSWVMRPILLKF